MAQLYELIENAPAVPARCRPTAMRPLNKTERETRIRKLIEILIRPARGSQSLCGGVLRETADGKLQTP
jgi:hypothetical protein